MGPEANFFPNCINNIKRFILSAYYKDSNLGMSEFKTLVLNWTRSKFRAELKRYSSFSSSEIFFLFTLVVPIKLFATIRCPVKSFDNFICIKFKVIEEKMVIKPFRY